MKVCRPLNPRRAKRCFAQHTWVSFCCGERPSSRARGVDIKDGYRRPPASLVCSTSVHQRSQSRCLSRVLVRKAQTNTETSSDGDFKQVKAASDGDYKQAKEYRPGCAVKQVGALSRRQYHSQRTSWLTDPPPRILCGGIHHQRQPEAERTSSEKGLYSDREEAKDHPRPARPCSLTSSARRTTVYKRTARCGRTGRTPRVHGL